MDIKDFILIGGGLLIAAVIAHGFLIAWRGRREPLRLDIVPDIIQDDVDDIVRLRGELPNGGARIAKNTIDEQELFDLSAAPILLEPSGTSPVAARETLSEERLDNAASFDESSIELPIVDESGEQASEVQPRAAEPIATAKPLKPQVAESIVAETSAANSVSKQRISGPPPRRPAARKDPEKPIEPLPDQAPVEELIVINVLAGRGEHFIGDTIFTVLGGKGLKFGNMNIFHRADPVTRVASYSVANVVEPGTFDMADMEAFRSPGLSFFLQLPGPENPVHVFEDMMVVARQVASELGGELKDEQRSFMTPQTVEHYRQRVADFSRRRMSKRA